MTRKGIIKNTYCYGGLLGAIALGIFTFICTRYEVWHLRLFLVIIMTVLFPGVCGVVLGVIAFILTLPFYKSIPWDIIEDDIIEDDLFSYPEKIFEPIKNRWSILDL